MVLRSLFFPCGSRFPSLPGVCSTAAAPVFLQVLHTHPWPQHPPPAFTFGSVCWVSCSVTRGVIPFKRVFLGASPVADVKDATLQHPPISQNPRSWNQPVANLRRTMRQRRIPSPLPPDGPHAFSFPCKALETQRMRIFAVAPGCCGADTPDFWIPFFFWAESWRRSTERLQEGAEPLLEAGLSWNLHSCVTDPSQIFTWALQGIARALLRHQPLPLSTCQILPAMLLRFLRARDS